MNVTPKRWPARALLAAALSTALPPVALSQSTSATPSNAGVRLPALGESAGEEISVGMERRIGDQILGELRRDPDYLDDPLLGDYLRRLWQPLRAAARARGDISAELDGAFAWETFLVRDRAVNAFALPGGYVGVHLGLMGMTGSADELASVLAHELSHVSQRHIARSVANAGRQSAVGIAAMLLGVLAASRSRSPDAAQAVIVGGQAAMAQGQLNFSRDMEREADRIGWGVFRDAGYAPQGVARMFEQLDQANRLADNGAWPYLRSHPLTVDRIGEARARVEAAGTPRGVPAGTLEHLLMQARARVLMDPAVQSLRRWQAQDGAKAEGAERVAALYAGALASIELREPARALAAIEAARAWNGAADRAATFTLDIAQAQALAASGQAQRALALLDAEPRSTADPYARSRLLARGQVALAAARAGAGATAPLRASAEALQTWLAEHRTDAAAWTQLAQSADLLGLKLRALRAEAEAQAALGDLPGAIDRLRAAQRQARAAGAAPDFVEASVIDARLRELSAQRRQQMAEARGSRAPEREPQ